MIINRLEEIRDSSIFQDVSGLLGLSRFYIKYEGLNIAGSIKLKTAIFLLNGLEESIGISPERNTIIESSSSEAGK